MTTLHDIEMLMNRLPKETLEERGLLNLLQLIAERLRYPKGKLLVSYPPDSVQIRYPLSKDEELILTLTHNIKRIK